MQIRSAVCGIFHSSGKLYCSPRLSMSADDGPRPRCLDSSEPNHLKHASANYVRPRKTLSGASPFGHASFLRSGFGEFFMSDIGVISVTLASLASSPILLHLVKRFLPLKSETKPNVTYNFNAPVYIAMPPAEPQPKLPASTPH
jgi:hypothetical protein